MAEHDTLDHTGLPGVGDGSISSGAAQQETVVTLTSGNTNVNLCSLTIASAPAGAYALWANFYVNTAGSSEVRLQAQSGGGGYTTMDNRDCRTTAGDRSLMAIYTHAGGNLDVRLLGVWEASNATLGLSADARWGRNLVVMGVGV